MNKKNLLPIVAVLFLAVLTSNTRAQELKMIETSSEFAQHIASKYPDQIKPISAIDTSTNGVSQLLVPFDMFDVLARDSHAFTKRCGGFIDITDESPQTRFDILGHKEATNLPPLTSAKPSIVRALQDVKPDNIEKFVKFMNHELPTRDARTAQGVMAPEWIKTQWQRIINVAERRFGRRDMRVELLPPPNGFKQPSIRLIIPGSDPSLPVVVLGAHLDSISSSASAPGADDDASGISSLTEMIRVMVLHRLQPKASIHIFGYAAEEYGLYGSRAIAEQYRSQGAKVRGVLQLDMTAYPGSSPAVTFMTDYVDKDLTIWTEQVFGLYVGTQTRRTRCGYACSDHAAWDRYGFPAAMPAETLMDDMNDRIHTPEDIWDERLDAKFAAQFVKLAYAFAAELSEAQ